MVRLKAKPGHKREVIAIRLSDVELAVLREAADLARLPLAVYIREVALRAAGGR